MHPSSIFFSLFLLILATPVVAQSQTDSERSFEEQARADRAADLAEMKARYRRFQEDAAARDRRERAAAEAEDYLWSAPRVGGAAVPSDTSAVLTARGVDQEQLRVEISRSLWEGRDFGAAPDAVLPVGTPEATSTAYAPTPEGLRGNVRDWLRREPLKPAETTPKKLD